MFAADCYFHNFTKRPERENMAHYFPYDVKLRLLAHSRSFLANQKARNAIVGAENLLNYDNGNRTEWSLIRSIIMRVINKIGSPRSWSPIC